MSTALEEKEASSVTCITCRTGKRREDREGRERETGRKEGQGRKRDGPALSGTTGM